MADWDSHGEDISPFLDNNSSGYALSEHSQTVQGNEREKLLRKRWMRRHGLVEGWNRSYRLNSSNSEEDVDDWSGPVYSDASGQVPIRKAKVYRGVKDLDYVGNDILWMERSLKFATSWVISVSSITFDDMSPTDEKEWRSVVRDLFGLPALPANGCETPPTTPEPDDKSNILHSPALTAGRRVVISNLPNETTLTQVLRGVRGVGGVLSASLFDTSKIKGQGAKSANIEFIYPASASAFVEYVSTKKPLFFGDANCQSHKANVWLVQAPLDQPLRLIDRVLLERGYTRAFVAENFPEQAVWFILCVFGNHNITEASYDSSTKSLRLEFASIFLAARAQRLLREAQCPYYYTMESFYDGPENSPSLRPIWDATHADVSELGFEPTTVPFISPLSREMCYKKHPYEAMWPTNYCHILEYEGLSPRSKNYEAERTKSYVSLLSKNLHLARDKWSWELDQTSEHETIIGTFNNPRFGPAWSSFFQENVDTSIDLQRWVRYAAIAKHRREVAREQGMREGAIPQCDNCEFGCRELATARLPNVIQEFLDREYDSEE